MNKKSIYAIIQNKNGGDNMGIRITGLSTPFGGISWEYSEAEKKGVQELFFFLETKRILVNPIEMEIKQWCIKSTIEIKKKITELHSQYDFSNHTTDCMRSMIDACNNFLDKLGGVKETGILCKNDNGDWADSTFSSAMKQFRKTFRDNIKLLSSAYNLTFNKNIPEQY